MGYISKEMKGCDRTLKVFRDVYGGISSERSPKVKVSTPGISLTNISVEGNSRLGQSYWMEEGMGFGHESRPTMARRPYSRDTYF